MPTFTEAYEAFEALPENRGKDRSATISEFVSVFNSKTGKNLADYEMSDQIPDFEAMAADDTEKAMAANEQRKEQMGLGEHIVDVGSKALRGIPRTAGIVAGAIETAIDPRSYEPGGAVTKAFTDYEELLKKTDDQDFLQNFSGNLLDLREATIGILATASGYSPTARGKTEVGTGREVGGHLAAGAIGGTAAMVVNPFKSLYGRPGDVLAILLSLRVKARAGDPVAKHALRRVEADMGKSGKGAGRNLIRSLASKELPAIPGMRKPVKRRPVEVGLKEASEMVTLKERTLRGIDDPLLETPTKPFSAAPEGAPLTVGDLAKSIATGTAVGLPFGVIEGAWMAPLARYLWGTAEATPAGARNLAKLRRFFADPAAQAIMADEAQVRQLLREPAKYRAMISREGEAIARSVEIASPDVIDGLKVTADEYKYHIDANEQSAYRPAERLRQRVDKEYGDKKLKPNHRRGMEEYIDQVRSSSRVSREIEIPIPKLSEQATLAMQQIYSHMDELNLSKRQFPEYQAAVFDAMSDGATLLMSEQLRNRLVDFVVDRNGLKGQVAIDTAIALQKNLLERFEKKAPVSTEFRGPPGDKVGQLVLRQAGSLRLPNNRTVSLADALEGTLGTMDDAERASVRSEVIGRVTMGAADDASRVAFERALRKETKRNTPKEMDSMIEHGNGAVLTPQYAESIALETIMDGHALNQALPKGMLPKNVADGVRGSLPELVRQSEKRVGRALTRQEHLELRRRVDDTANTIERYEEFTDDTKQFLPEEDLKSWPQIDQDLSTLPSETAGRATSSIYVSPGFNRTVWWNTLSKRWSGSVFDSLNNFSSLLKANLTVHNPSTHVGNYISNVGLDSLRLGHSPLRVIFNTTNEARKYLAYKKGKTLSPMDMRTYKAIDYSKLFTSDLVHAELGVMRRVSKSSPYGQFQKVASLIGKPGTKAWKAYDKAMKEGYKWGDQSFKIHEASRTFRELATAIERLDDGDYIRFQTSPVTHTILTKQGGKIMRGADELTPEALDRTIAAASVRKAFDLFVDYTQVPGLLMLMRQLGPLSIASPFVTWFWRTMDFPGKKGLIYRTLIDDPTFSTNNASLTRGALMNSLYTQSRRMLMFNGLRETLHDNRDAMRQLVRLQGQPYGSALLHEASNPGYFTYMRMSNTDFFSPGMHTVRVVAGLMAKRLELEDFDDLSKTQKRLVQRMARGDVANMKDVFSMAAMSGGPIIEAMYQGITNRNRYGRPPVAGEWVKQLLPVVFGQLPTKAVDVALQGMGIWDESTLLSQRFYSQSSRDPNEREDFGPWALRTLSGLGWRDASAQNRTGWYAKNISREMERSLAGAAKKKMKQLRNIGKNKEADLLMGDYQEAIKRIRMEMTVIKEEGRDLINALEHGEQLRINPDMQGTLAAEELE